MTQNDPYHYIIPSPQCGWCLQIASSNSIWHKWRYVIAIIVMFCGIKWRCFAEGPEIADVEIIKRVAILDGLTLIIWMSPLKEALGPPFSQKDSPVVFEKVSSHSQRWPVRGPQGRGPRRLLETKEVPAERLQESGNPVLQPPGTNCVFGRGFPPWKRSAGWLTSRLKT